MTKHTKPAAPASSVVMQPYACTLCGVACDADRDEPHALARLCDCCHALTGTEAHLLANNFASIAQDAHDVIDYVETMLARGGRMHPLAERLRARADAYLVERLRARAAIAAAIRDNADKLAALLPSVCFTVETVAHLRGLERDLLPMCDEVRKLMGEPMLANAVRS